MAVETPVPGSKLWTSNWKAVAAGVTDWQTVAVKEALRQPRRPVPSKVGGSLANTPSVG